MNVHASGFSPHERVVVSECIAGTPTYGISCGLTGGGGFFPLQADDQGVVDTSLRVHRVVQPSGGVIIIAADGPVNCSDSVGACVLRVQSIDDPLVVSATSTLGFDPTAVAPGPTITMTPAGPHADGQEVVVHGEGYTPNATLGLAQCSSDAPNPGGSSCDSGPDGLFTGFQAEADGTFTRTVTLHTQVETTEGELDCSAAGSCVMFAANRSDYGVERASMPLEFAAARRGRTGRGGGGHLADPRAGVHRRGASTAPSAVVGVGLVLLGGALVLLARRRKATA